MIHVWTLRPWLWRLRLCALLFKTLFAFVILWKAGGHGVWTNGILFFFLGHGGLGGWNVTGFTFFHFFSPFCNVRQFCTFIVQFNVERPPFEHCRKRGFAGCLGIYSFGMPRFIPDWSVAVAHHLPRETAEILVDDQMIQWFFLAHGPRRNYNLNE